MTLQRVGTIPIVEGGGEQVGGTLEYREFLQSVDLANVATIVAASQNVTITGIAIGDIPLYVCPAEALVANIAVTALGPCAAANVLVCRVLNPTAAGIDAAAVNFRVGVLRPSMPAV
jgi:hypothetical protein